MARVATAPRQDGEFCFDAMPARGARVFARSRVGDRCYVAGERVVASSAGTSCEIDRSACKHVRLAFTEVACPQSTPWRGERREQIPTEVESKAPVKTIAPEQPPLER